VDSLVSLKHGAGREPLPAGVAVVNPGRRVDAQVSLQRCGIKVNGPLKGRGFNYYHHINFWNTLLVSQTEAEISQPQAL